jgi:hypothetical protein
LQNLKFKGKSSMTDIKNNLLKLENEFETLRLKTEKYHLVFIILYFIPPVAAIIIYSKFYKEFFNFYIKIIIYAIILSGLAAHYYLRYKFYKSKKRYKKFIDNKLDEIKKIVNDDDNFKKIIVENAKEIFQQNSIELSNITIKNNQFWHLIFINLGIELENDLR